MCMWFLSVVPELDASVCLVTLDFILQYEKRRMYHLPVLFASKNRFIFMNSLLFRCSIHSKTLFFVTFFLLSV